MTSRHPYRMALAALLLLTGAFTGSATLLPSPASAATSTIDQCNGVGPSAEGATTAMTCTVTVTNTLDGGQTRSSTTVTRQCALGPCPAGNGTFSTRSAALITSVKQCNGSSNDAAHPIRCDVRITNNISADSLSALPLRAATVSQCVGSGQGGGGSTTGCDPTPASVTSATVTQCNGSGNGGGGVVACTVDKSSRVSRAVPVTVNQCNGTGNPGGSTLTCSARITTTITAARAGGPARGTGSVPPQVTQVPVGGVAAGGGSTSGVERTGWLGLGGGLLLAAVATPWLRRRRALG